MLESTYNLLLTFAFLTFVFSAVLSVLERITKEKAQMEEGFKSAFKIILMGFSALLFLICAMMAGNITTMSSTCAECQVTADSGSIMLYGALSFFSFVMLMFYLLVSFYEARG